MTETSNTPKTQSTNYHVQLSGTWTIDINVKATSPEEANKIAEQLLDQNQLPAPTYGDVADDIDVTEEFPEYFVNQTIYTKSDTERKAPRAKKFNYEDMTFQEKTETHPNLRQVNSIARFYGCRVNRHHESPSYWIWSDDPKIVKILDEGGTTVYVARPEEISVRQWEIEFRTRLGYDTI